MHLNIIVKFVSTLSCVLGDMLIFCAVYIRLTCSWPLPSQQTPKTDAATGVLVHNSEYTVCVSAIINLHIFVSIFFLHNCIQPMVITSLYHQPSLEEGIPHWIAPPEVSSIFLHSFLVFFEGLGRFRCISMGICEALSDFACEMGNTKNRKHIQLGY